MDPFRSDNTDGYTASELVELNSRFWDAGGGDLDPLIDSDEYKAMGERVQRDYDSEQSVGYGTTED